MRGALRLDFTGHPQKYDQLQVLSDVVAKEVNVLKVDAPEQGRGWKRTHSEIDTSELPPDWKKKVADGADFVLRETWVKANDPHYVFGLSSAARAQGLNEFPSGRRDSLSLQH